MGPDDDLRQLSREDRHRQVSATFDDADGPAETVATERARVLF